MLLNFMKNYFNQVVLINSAFYYFAQKYYLSLFYHNLTS